ncbi:hypothetical protein CEXT_252001 [Caerostris extrusa]|uniref:Uncharacterized protein n=1 Tax=Caerostris extrusa TaxID=172846 RepID=A0AAV4TK06_CAEEX|nr:hypothetical protein CEXT_252001 [Caerostris extrusa]
MPVLSDFVNEKNGELLQLCVAIPLIITQTTVHSEAPKESCSALFELEASGMMQLIPVKERNFTFKRSQRAVLFLRMSPDSSKIMRIIRDDLKLFWNQLSSSSKWFMGT